MFSVFENSEKMILVMEYCSGGELYDYLSQKKVLQEDEARRLDILHLMFASTRAKYKN